MRKINHNRSSALLPKWVKTWCCQAIAMRVGADLRCKSCGNRVFDDYAVQKLIVEDEPHDTSEMVPNPKALRSI
jgi:hypothetical protein